VDELAARLGELLGDPAGLARLSERSRRLVDESRGAAEKTADLLAGLLPSGAQARQTKESGA
jgi:hypothetical protein